jgi:hypothetical protein
VHFSLRLTPSGSENRIIFPEIGKSFFGSDRFCLPLFAAIIERQKNAVFFRVQNNCKWPKLVVKCIGEIVFDAMQKSLSKKLQNAVLQQI